MMPIYKLIIAAVTFALFLAPGAALAEQPADSEKQAKKPARETQTFRKVQLPDSLLHLYPPETAGYPYYDDMVKLGDYFTTLKTAIEQNNWPAGAAAAKQFLPEYAKSASLVPEWRKYYDTAAAKRLEDACQTWSKPVIARALKVVDATCETCHRETARAIRSKYYFPEYRELKVENPDNGRFMTFGEANRELEVAMFYMEKNARAGNYGPASIAAKRAKIIYRELRITCEKCHYLEPVTDKFVSTAELGAFEKIEEILLSANPNMAEFAKNDSVIRKNGCDNCHASHNIPASRVKLTGSATKP